MERKPKRSLTIDPRSEGVKLDLGIGEIHIRVRRHGKNHVTVEWEQVGSLLVASKTQNLDNPQGGSVD